MEEEQQQHHIGRHIGRAHKFIRAWGDQLLAPLGATVTDWILLFHIQDAPGRGLSQADLAKFADMASSGLVRYLDRYEEEGLVERRRDEEDRRVLRLRLTDAGRARLDEMGVVMIDTDAQLRSLLTEDQQEVLTTALDTLFRFALHEVTSQRQRTTEETT